MFKKILIANRGEIACRIIKSAKAMGIPTVAVYSDADARALHVLMADEAVQIGPAPAAASYLVMEAILAACKESGADAVHPGYGFLSEKAAFRELLDAHGIAFIGPPAGAITAMGDKITSKQIAARAGVNTIPGFDGIIEDPEHAVAVAREIGYPVMLKASAGGGGKGMRVAWNEEECRQGFSRAASEARSSFGDDRLLVEKFIEEPRHIEIQIVADSHGNCLYLGERECSVQRRHQKVLEEAPSPFLDAATRRAMGEQAVALARAVDYSSAGTVEFIVDRNRNFYFLEMNTRLQVEHPVTEMITGLDLVELMIRVAAGEALPLSQQQVKLKGWALESRVYAEDPLRGFLPSTGRLSRYLPPEEEADHVRVDSGVFEGGEISMHYDPMIAKLVTWGRDRNHAILCMRAALDEFVIQGVRHNIPFLGALVAHPRFSAGRLSTAFIAEEYPDGFQGGKLDEHDLALCMVVAGIIHRLFMDRAAQISGQLPGHERRVTDDWVVIHDGRQHPVSVKPFQSDCNYRVEFGGSHYAVLTDWSFCQPLLRGTINGRQVAFQVQRRGVGYRLVHGGAQLDLLVLTPGAAALYSHMPEEEAADFSRFLLAPMPGLLIKLAVREGQEVKAGEELAVMEAMKMENILTSSRDGVIARINVQPGASLTVDQVILEFA